MNVSKTKLLTIALLTLTSGVSNAQTPSERKEITKEYNLEKLSELEKTFRASKDESFAKAKEIALSKGLPLKGIDAEGKYYALMGLNSDGGLMYCSTYNNVSNSSSIKTARVEDLHLGSEFNIGDDTIEGQQMTLGIWDGGPVFAGHQSLGAARITNKDGAVETSGNLIGIQHATHVAGTMIGNASISSIKGMAPKASLWSNDFENDFSEMAAQAAQGLLVSNHSYGTDHLMNNYQNSPGIFGRYVDFSKKIDQILYNADKYLAVFAAGNSRSGDYTSSGMVYYNVTKNGYDLLSDRQVSKNSVVVAAVSGVEDYTGPSDVIMSDFSQWGPTDDFRIKPDISAKGVDVKSAFYTSAGASNTSATSVQQGTSMAAPSVTGVFALWQQYYKKINPFIGYMRASTVKALMAISADEAGPTDGPDPMFGWGLINAKKGAEIIRDSKPSKAVNVAEIIESELSNGDVYELEVATDGNAPLRVALSWTDPAGDIVYSTDSSTPVLVNDLDVRIVRPNGQEIKPWALVKDWVNSVAQKADNNVDPLEVVEYSSPFANGNAPEATYTIRVSHKGTLSSSQKFSLVVQGIETKAPMSVNDFSFSNLKVSPNPSSDKVTISADLVAIEGASVEFYDVAGKKVISKKDIFYNTNSASIDVSFLNQGVYILKIKNGGQSQEVKFVKK